MPENEKGRMFTKQSKCKDPCVYTRIVKHIWKGNGETKSRENDECVYVRKGIYACMKKVREGRKGSWKYFCEYVSV